MSTPLNTVIAHVANSKGGIGKTSLVSNLSQYLDTLEVSHVLIDADEETSTLSRLHPTARFLAIRNPLELDTVIQIALAERPKVVLIDLPARAGDEFHGWFELIPFTELQAAGVAFTSIGLIAGNKDSVESVLRWREVLGRQSRFVLALNKRDDLATYLSSNARKGFLADRLPEIEFPRLDERFATELDRQNWTIAQALSSSEPHFLTQLMSRARLRRYRDHVFAQFDQIRSHLLP